MLAIRRLRYLKNLAPRCGQSPCRAERATGVDAEGYQTSIGTVCWRSCAEKIKQLGLPRAWSGFAVATNSDVSSRQTLSAQSTPESWELAASRNPTMNKTIRKTAMSQGGEAGVSNFTRSIP